MTLEEKYDALKGSHQEVVDRCNDLENKLKAADEFINIWEGYLEDETGSFYKNLTKAIEHYKSLI